MWQRVVVVLVATGVMCGGRLAAEPVRINTLGWMQGCWQLTSNGRTIDEQWMAPGGGAMLGTSRTVVNGTLTEFEFVVLREKGETLVYEAHPAGQFGASFTLASTDATSVVFENLTHDFPQRIGYRRHGDRLDAWIEGTLDGRAQRAEFPYARVACPAK